MAQGKVSSWQRNATVFLGSQTISLFGSMLVQYAITWFITLETQSGLMMTVAIVCGFLPTFFVSPFGGVWADRYDRKVLIVLADAMIALSTLILAVLFLSGYGSVWLLFAFMAVRAVGAGVQTPAVGAFLPQIVPPESLTRVNATFGSVQSLVTLVSPVLSGAMLTMATIESIFFVDVVTGALAVTVMLALVRVPAHARARQKHGVSYFEDVRVGIDYIRKHGFLLILFAFCGAFFVLVAPLAFLTPLQVTRTFGSDVWRLTALEVVYSVGMIAGGAAVALWGGFANKLHTMVASNTVVAVATVALGVVPDFWVYLALMALVGLALPAFNTPFTVLLQLKVEEGFLGRVFGVLGMISSLTMPLAMLLFGPLADLVRIESLLVVTGVLLLALSVLMLRNKALLEAGEAAPLDRTNGNPRTEHLADYRTST